MKGKILINEFIHSETQHGKTILDAHFATTNRHLKNFMLTYTQNRVTRIQTPLGLAFALSFNTGVRNTIVQLIELSDTNMKELSFAIDPIVKNSKTYFTRVNHIYYDDPTNDNLTNPQDIKDHFSEIKFTLKVQAFSNIDKPFVFAVDLERNIFNPIGPIIEHDNILVNYNDSGTNDSRPVDNNDLNILLPDADFSFSKRGFRTNHNLRNKSIIDIEKEIDSSTKQTNDLSEYSSSSDEDDDDYIYESSEEDDSETELLLSESVKNSNIQRYGPPVGEHYNESMMMTGIKIVKM